MSDKPCAIFLGWVDRGSRTSAELLRKAFADLSTSLLSQLSRHLRDDAAGPLYWQIPEPPSPLRARIPSDLVVEIAARLEMFQNHEKRHMWRIQRCRVKKSYREQFSMPHRPARSPSCNGQFGRSLTLALVLLHDRDCKNLLTGGRAHLGLSKITSVRGDASQTASYH